MDVAKDALRLYAVQPPDSANNLWDVPNVLLQKWPAETFVATAKLSFTPNPKLENEKAGLVVMGLTYASIALKRRKDGIWLVYSTCKDAYKGTAEAEKTITKVNDSTAAIYLRVQVRTGAKCRFGYSLDGNDFTDLDADFQAEPGRWIGAKTGLFCIRPTRTNDAGFVDVDWFRVDKITETAPIKK
jgi:hypothetical protein